MEDDQHEPSAAERQAAAAERPQLHGPPPDPGPGPVPEPEDVADPGPCKDCTRRGDMLLAVVALGVAAVIAVMAVDLMTGGQLSAVVFGRPSDASE